MKRIRDYRRIGNWENFFLDSAIYSIAAFVGTVYDNGFTPIAAITGDLFTYMYSESMPCDSGLTNYVVMPERVIKAFASFGWNCEYLSREDVERDTSSVIQKICASIDRGLPVLAWGVGGVPGMRRGDRMGEGAFIGGYDGRALLIHLYCGAERLPAEAYDGCPAVDEDGYTAILADDAVAGTDGIFIPTERGFPADLNMVCREVVMRIPDWLTMAPSGGRVSDTEQYAFGKAAFSQWKQVLLDDTFWQDCTEDVVWKKHGSAYCSLCTSTGSFDGDSRVVDWLKRAATVCPELPVIANILPLYQEMGECCRQIWNIHGGFMPSAENMRIHDFRTEIASVLSRMGDCCDEIVQAFWG